MHAERCVWDGKTVEKKERHCVGRWGYVACEPVLRHSQTKGKDSFWSTLKYIWTKRAQIYSVCVIVNPTVFIGENSSGGKKNTSAYFVCSQLLNQHPHKSRQFHGCIFSALKRLHTCLHTGRTEQQNPTRNKEKRDSCPKPCPKQQLALQLLISEELWWGYSVGSDICMVMAEWGKKFYIKLCFYSTLLII